MQEKEQHEKKFGPPVDEIKKFEVDPYTLQVESDDQIDEGDKEEGGPKTNWWDQMAWKIRQPDNPSQYGLKSGYEKIIQKKRLDKARRENPILEVD